MGAYKVVHTKQTHETQIEHLELSKDAHGKIIEIGLAEMLP